MCSDIGCKAHPFEIQATKDKTLNQGGTPPLTLFRWVTACWERVESGFVNG